MSKTPAPHFTPAAITFLRGLKRNNDRTWFAARKPVFEAELQRPMLALVEQITHAMEEFAPQHLRPANKTVLRFYRDTRFSADKRPYKNHIAAWWLHTGLPRTSGAGFYMHLSATEFTIAAGIYMPTPEQLLALRNFIAQDATPLRRELEKKSLRRLLPELTSNPLTRVPKGFAADHPAADLLRYRQWGLSVSLPADTALKPTLSTEILKRFRAAAPLIELLNTPLAQKPRSRPLF
jgi:uncharacterized protein (TIGR02453 family)